METRKSSKLSSQCSSQNSTTHHSSKQSTSRRWSHKLSLRYSSPHLESSSASTSSNGIYYADNSEFYEHFHQAEIAIELGLLPKLISKGSSGSYFARNTNKKIVGIFKPKDEEPYGNLNPKWKKYIHKHFCPCCYGRTCLVHNQGYLSEAGASLVDRMLELNVVPPTNVVRLASEAFNYSAIDRAKARTKQNIYRHVPMVGKRFNRLGLRRKVGSFQLFVEGYKDADVWLKYFDNYGLKEATAAQFQRLFERMVVLDYIIRNTDRGNNNWLIKFIPATVPTQANKSEHSVDGDHKEERDEIAIAAIDNGLAFPCKHPDEWRTYPFHWAWLPYAKVPFSNEIQELVLSRLQDNSFVQELQYNLYQQFKIDKSFDLGLFEKQMSVMRGQIINLTTALRDGQTPLQLVQMPTLTVHCNTPVQVKTLSIRHDFSTCTIDGKSSSKKFSLPRVEPKFTHNVSKKKAVFSCC